MRSSTDTWSWLVGSRFLCLLAHLCATVTLLWESEQSVRRCLPTQHHQQHYNTFHARLVGGYGASIAMILLELITFITGVTMFSSTVALTSIFCHGLAAVTLTYFVIDSWLCDTFWIIFFFCSVMPSVTDTIAAIFTLCTRRW